MPDVDAILAEACKSENGAIRIAFITADLKKLAPIYADPETRPIAEAVLAKWAEGDDELRKGISADWIARARNVISGAGKVVAKKTGMAAVAGAVKGAVKRGEDKAGDIGAKIGEKVAPHTGEGRDLKRVAEGKGPAKTEAGKAVQQKQDETHKGITDYGKRAFRASEGEGLIQAPRGRQSAAVEHREDEYLKTFNEAANHKGQQIAEGAVTDHASRAAKQGRVVARHAFKAGLAAGAAGAGVAVAGAVSGGLSERQHQQRIDAARSQRRARAQARMGGQV